MSSVQYKYDAFFIYTEEDAEFVYRLHHDLEGIGLNIYIRARDSLHTENQLEGIENAIKNSRRYVCFQSKSFPEDPLSEFTKTSTQYQEAIDDKLKNIYVLRKDCDEQDESLLPVNHYIKETDKDFFEKLKECLKAPDVKLTDCRPCIGMGRGFALGYFYGYLNLILAHLPRKIRESKWFDPDPEGRKIPLKLLIFIPKSCNCKGFSDADTRFKHCEQLPELSITRAGNINRSYRNNVHQVTRNGSTYYFAGELATPVLSMFEMEQDRLAGLDVQEKYRQVVIFYETLVVTLQSGFASHCRNAYRILFYDDEKTDLAELAESVIIEEIKNDLKLEAESSQKPEHGLEHQMSDLSVAPTV